MKIEKIDEKILDVLIENNKENADNLYKLFDRYRCGSEGTPIKTRRYVINGVEQTEKINRKINNNFFKEIIDQKVGYMVGNPIVYGINKNNYSESGYEEIIDKIQYFSKINSLSDLDCETIKQVSISGSCGRLLYINQDGDVGIKVIPSHELIFIGDLFKPDFSIWHYKIETLIENEIKTVYLAEVYDSSTVTYYIQGKNLSWTIDIENKYNNQIPGTANGIATHEFIGNPLIGFLNNEEFMGDCNGQLDLIDSYDRILSDVNNELEQFRLAYMVARGCQLTDDVIQKAAQTGGLSIPNPDGSIEFLTKDLNDTLIEHVFTRIEKNIFSFSMAFNIRDETFAGNVTGIALLFKLKPFDYKCITSENKFDKSCMEMFRLICDIWNRKGLNIDYLDIEIIHSRALPRNLLEEAQTSQTLKGLVSEKTRLSLLSFIDDTDKEIEQMKEDNENMIDLDKIELDSTSPDETGKNEEIIEE